MEQLARLPDDFVFYTQITMESAEDPEFLDAMRKAHIRGALVGVESVTPEGLKAVFKNFNDAGEALVDRLQAFRTHGIHILGSFIFGLPTDKADTFSSDRRPRSASGRELRAVRHADAVPRHARHADLEVVPPDVREHRHRNRQRANESLRTVGAMAGPAMPSLVRHRPRAGSPERWR
jgi:hypothetical protein